MPASRFIGAGLCAAYCVLPIIGTLFGLGALALIAKYHEIAGVIAIVAAITFFTISLVRGRKAPACDRDCPCKD